MALCWRGTFIDLDEPAEDKLPRRRSSSTPAACRQEHFNIERSYIKTLAKRVGFPEDAAENRRGHPAASKVASRSVGALPLLPAAPLDDDVSDYEEDEDDDEFFADWATVTEAVQSLSSLPLVRTCGTTVTTMDSLCSLGDVPECDEVACCEGKPFRDFNFDVSRVAGSQDRQRRHSFTSQAASETDYATFADPSPGDESGWAPYHAGTSCMPDPADDTETESTRSSDEPCPATAPRTDTRTALAFGDTTEVVQQEEERLELPGPNMQCSILRPPADPSCASGHPKVGRACSWARGTERGGGSAEEWDSEAEEDGWGQAVEQEEMDECEDGAYAPQGWHEVAPVTTTFQNDDVVDVAFKDKVALIFVSQNITTVEDADSLHWAISVCREKGEAIAAVLLWIEAAPPRRDQQDAQPCSEPVTREHVMEIVEELTQLQYPVMGFASGSCGVWTTLLTAGCDQILSLASADFCVQNDDGDFRVVSAERGAEMGFVARLEGSTEALLQGCSAFMDQVDRCSKDELACMKSSLRGSHGHLPVEARAPFPGQLQVVPTVRATSPAPAHLSVPAVPAVPAVSPMQAVQAVQAVHMPVPVVVPSMAVFVAYGPYPANQAPMPAAVPVEAVAARGDVGPSAAQKGHAPCQQDVTTLMLRNLPCRLSQQQLTNIIDSLGFREKVDYMHFPTSKGSANPGYVFVNFVSPEEAARFTVAFKNYRFANSRTNKVPDVMPARVQGRLAMMEQLERRPC